VVNPYCLDQARSIGPAYSGTVPRLWSETIESHRRDVGDAIVDTTAALVSEHGLRAVTMSQIAEGAGIGRATLYKYFPDVEAILVAEHVGHAQHRLIHFVQDLIARAVAAGDVRDDIAPDELAGYCLHSLAGAADLPSKAAVRRLVTVTLAGLRPEAGGVERGDA